MTNLIKEMLLIEEPSILRLYREMTRMCSYFIAPLFMIAIVLEFCGKLDFPGVVKRLFIVVIFLGSFQVIHKEAVNISMEAAYKTLKKVSPRNIFVKKWYYSKLSTKKKKGWGWLEKFVVPNLNDLLATGFFLLARVCIWLLKLIYSSVYHLTYVFCGISSLLYFFRWTDKGLVGTVQSSLWCVVMPFVVISVLALVGNTLDERAIHGMFVASDIQTIIWLFGVTLILLITPLITWGMVHGEGVASTGSQMGQIAVRGMTSTVKLVPSMINSVINMRNSTAYKVVRGATNSTLNRFRSGSIKNSATSSKIVAKSYSKPYTQNLQNKHMANKQHQNITKNQKVDKNVPVNKNESRIHNNIKSATENRPRETVQKNTNINQRRDKKLSKKDWNKQIRDTTRYEKIKTISSKRKITKGSKHEV